MVTRLGENEVSIRLAAHVIAPTSEIVLHPKRLISVPVKGPEKKNKANPKEPTHAKENNGRKHDSASDQ